MKVIAQPESYSDMLERVFHTTFFSGFVCTLILASASPAVKKVLDSIQRETEIGPIKGLKTLYVLVPIGIALISRIVRLHDKISDVFHIRVRFDTQYILFPMAELSGFELEPAMKRRIHSLRESVMYKVFYPYAGFAAPEIDKQLVRTALDNWGWFWVGVESGLLFAVTAIIVKIVGGPTQFYICLLVLLVIGLLLAIQWHACRRSAKRQVEAIIEDSQRKTDIHAYFDKILEIS